jgi:hypothetical protein
MNILINKEFWTKWIAALRSGEYVQGKGYLNRKEKYCCLGVAVDILDPNGWKGSFDVKCYEKEEACLTKQTLQKIGLSFELQAKLVKMNDNGHDFKSIADFLEKEMINGK